MPRPKKFARSRTCSSLAKQIAGSKTAGNKTLVLAGADQEEGLKCVERRPPARSDQAAADRRPQARF